jgi:glycine/D-amino acid oxidase-like deaminating enzyme
MEFQDRSVLVTGAAGGIGRATAVQFAKEGARLTLSDRDTVRGEETLSAVRAVGGTAQFIYGDVVSEPFVQHLVDAAVKTYGRLDCASSASPTRLQRRCCGWPPTSFVCHRSCYADRRRQYRAVIWVSSFEVETELSPWTSRREQTTLPRRRPRICPVRRAPERPIKRQCAPALRQISGSRADAVMATARCRTWRR